MKVNPIVRASFELLGLGTDATQTDLKKAYHRLALLYHPDRNPDKDAHDEFRKVTEAYELLCDLPRVTELNRKYLRGKLHTQVVEGFEVTFGSFFGYRLFDPEKAFSKSSALRLEGKSTAKSKAAGKSADDPADRWIPLEENNSILDHPAFDAIEVVYAGRMSMQDEAQLKGKLDGSSLVQLPWVVLNNQGILRFLDGDLRRATKCYAELCERVPNNIIFMYRLGLCLILDGFQKPRRTLLGALKPDRIKVEKGIALLKHCLKLAEERPVGRQKCLVIRKILADVLERTGKPRQASAVWRDIKYEDPRCAEAAFKLKDFAKAKKLARAKQQTEKRDTATPLQLRVGRFKA